MRTTEHVNARERMSKEREIQRCFEGLKQYEGDMWRVYGQLRICREVGTICESVDSVRATGLGGTGVFGLEGMCENPPRELLGRDMCGL